jgi:hypothetical protein
MQSLLGEETVVWTVPVPIQAREMVQELDIIERVGGDDERKEEILSSLPMLEQIRLTFGSVTVVEGTKRDELLFQVREDFEGNHGIDPASFSRWFQQRWISEDEATPSPFDTDMSEKESLALYNRLQEHINWATVMSCLKKVEERQAPMMNGSDPEWRNVGVPKEWYTFEGFVASVPTALFDKMVEVCNGLNPSFWGVGSKNFGGVSLS